MLIEYAPITVSYAKEITSVSICYSQGGGFNTSLSRLFYNCTVHRSQSSWYTSLVFVGVRLRSLWYRHVPPETTLVKTICVYTTYIVRDKPQAPSRPSRVRPELRGHLAE